MENIWRLDLRTAIPKERYSELLKHCAENNILGIGWRGIDKQNFKNSIEKAYAESAKIKIAERRIFLFSQIVEGDFVWVKSENTYALCRVTKKWYDTPYVEPGDADAMYFDLYNYVEAEWIIFDDKYVPGFVVNAFESSKATIAKMKTENTIICRALWNIYKGTKLNCSIDPFLKEYKDMFWNLITKKNLDDLIAIILQKQGYYIVSIHNIQTDLNYNPIVTLKHRETGETGYFFVNYQKSINVSDFEYLLDKVDKIFLFTPSIYRKKIKADNIVLLKKQKILEFIEGHINEKLNQSIILPDKIKDAVALRDKIYSEIDKYI